MYNGRIRVLAYLGVDVDEASDRSNNRERSNEEYDYKTSELTSAELEGMEDENWKDENEDVGEDVEETPEWQGDGIASGVASSVPAEMVLERFENTMRRGCLPVCEDWATPETVKKYHKDICSCSESGDEEKVLSQVWR